MEDFWISPPRGSVNRSRRQRDQEEYIEGLRQGLLGGAYVEEQRRSCSGIEELMDVTAVGTDKGRRWEPRSTSRPAFRVSKAADATMWEDLKDVRSPMYNGNPLNLDHFLDNLGNWCMTVTEDMGPAAAEKCVFKRFRWRLSEGEEVYFVTAKEGKVTTLLEPRKWLHEQERMYAPQVAAKRWRAIKLQHDGREICLRDWRDLRGQYVLFCQNVED